MDTGDATIRRAEVLRREIYDLTQAMVKLVEMRANPPGHFVCGNMCNPPVLILDTCKIHGIPWYRTPQRSSTNARS